MKRVVVNEGGNKRMVLVDTSRYRKAHDGGEQRLQSRMNELPRNRGERVPFGDFARILAATRKRERRAARNLRIAQCEAA
jgi:hypothetical protein